MHANKRRNPAEWQYSGEELNAEAQMRKVAEKIELHYQDPIRLFSSPRLRVMRLRVDFRRFFYVDSQVLD
jgi:hypothetical protein